MRIALFRVAWRDFPRRVDRKRLRAASALRPEWLKAAKEAGVYFGATLLPLVTAIVLHELGLIA
jgi:hypothetical protein